MAEAAPRLPDCPRTRLIVALILAFAFASVTQITSLPLLAAFALAALVASGQPLAVLARLRAPAMLALAIALALALFSGSDTLWQAGPLHLRSDGVAAGALVALRLLAIVTLTLVLLGSLPPHKLAEALRSLGLPAILSDLVMLTLRYIDEMRARLARAEAARRLRGGGAGSRALPERAAVFATALIHGQHRADRVWAAMRLRHYGAARPATRPFGLHDLLWIGAALALAAALVWLDRAT